MKTSFGVVIEWLAILLIAFYALPMLLQLLFGNVEHVGTSSAQWGIGADPWAAADYKLAQNILHMQ